MSDTVLGYALVRAGIAATVSDTTGTVVVVLDNEAAADLAERILRTVPLRGNADPWPGEAVPAGGPAMVGRTWYEGLHQADPNRYAPPTDPRNPKVTLDTSLAVVPEGHTHPRPNGPADSTADCTCMLNVLRCAVHGNPTSRTLPADADLPTQTQTATSPEDDAAATQGDPSLDVTGGR